jgi:hypothetical protein
MAGEFSNILLTVIIFLISLPFLLWFLFNRWHVWPRLLEKQLDRLVHAVEDLRVQRPFSLEIIDELKEYIETVNQILNDQRRSSRFLTVNETNDMGTIINITRELVNRIRGSTESEENLSSYLETRRKTIASLFERMVGRK